MRVVERNEALLYCRCPQPPAAAVVGVRGAACRCTADGYAVGGGGNVAAAAAASQQEVLQLNCFGLSIQATKLNVESLVKNIGEIADTVASNLEKLRAWTSQRLADYELHIYQKSKSEGFDLHQTFLRVSNASDALKKGQKIIDDWFSNFSNQANHVRLILTQDYVTALHELENHCSAINHAFMTASIGGNNNVKIAKKIISMRKRSTTLLNRYMNRLKNFIEEFQQLLEMLEAFNKGCILETERQRGKRNIVKRKCFDLKEMLNSLNELFGTDNESPLERVRTHLSSLLIQQRSEINRIIPQETLAPVLDNPTRGNNVEINDILNTPALLISQNTYAFLQKAYEFINTSIYRPASKMRLDKMIAELHNIIDKLDVVNRELQATQLLIVAMNILPVRTPDDVNTLLRRKVEMARNTVQLTTVRIEVEMYKNNLIEQDQDTLNMLNSILEDIQIGLNLMRDDENAAAAAEGAGVVREAQEMDQDQE